MLTDTTGRSNFARVAMGGDLFHRLGWLTATVAVLTVGCSGGQGDGNGSVADTFVEQWVFSATVSTAACVGIGCPAGAAFDGSTRASAKADSGRFSVQGRSSSGECVAAIRMYVPDPPELRSYKLATGDSFAYYEDCPSGTLYSTDASPAGTPPMACPGSCSGSLEFTHFEPVNDRSFKVSGRFNFTAIQRFDDSPIRSIDDGVFSNF